MKKKLITLSAIAIGLFSACSKDNNALNNYTINEATSLVEWRGSATDHFHDGSFAVSGSFNTQANGKIKSGDFTIPISSIKNYDLPDPVKPELLNHLKGPEFFNMVVHPNASFNITEVTNYTTADANAIEGANYVIKGDFTLLGNTHPLTFPARITTSGDSLITEAKFKFNRLQWGMTSYNDPTKELFLLPDIEIKLNIRSAKQ